MPLITRIEKSSPSKHLYAVLLIAGLSGLISSCLRSRQDPLAYSAEFKKIYDQANREGTKNQQLAVHYLDSAFSTIEHPTLNDRFTKLGYHFRMAGNNQHDNRKALLYADSMLYLINQNGGEAQNPSNYAEANFARGDAYFGLNNYTEAYRCYFNGYRIGKKYLDKYVLSGYSYRMGMISYKQENYQLAASCFKDSFDQFLPYDSEFVVFYRNQEVLDNLGLSYQHLHKADSALYYFQYAVRYIDQKKYRFKEQAGLLTVAKAVIYGNEADIFIEKKQYGKAIALLQTSIGTNIGQGNDNYDAVQSEIKLANIYQQLGNNHLMLPVLNAVQQQLRQVTDKQAEAEWNRLMSDYSLKMNKLTAAILYNRRYNVLKDSLLESKRSLKDNDLSQQLSNDEKEHKMEILTGKYRLQQVYLNLAGIVFAMGLVIILLIYRNARITKKALHTVNLLNGQVNDQKISLEKTLGQLTESGHEKDRILHTVAHDLRNPLGGIASLTQAMITEDQFLDGQKEYIEIINATAADSLVLISEIFEATNHQTIETHQQLVDINMLLNNSLELLRFRAAEKSQSVLLSPLPHPVELMISREQISRVINNLLVNAIKFSPVGANIQVTASETDREVLIAVSDEGIGIPDDIKPRIFNMFTDAKRTGTTGEKSYGLGLSICCHIIEAHNGRIWFEPNIPKGTTFYVALAREHGEHPLSSGQASTK